MTTNPTLTLEDAAMVAEAQAYLDSFTPQPAAPVAPARTEAAREREYNIEVANAKEKLPAVEAELRRARDTFMAIEKLGDSTNTHRARKMVAGLEESRRDLREILGDMDAEDTPTALMPTMQLSTPLTVIHSGLLRTNLRHDPIADEENVRLLLEREPNLQGIARFNEFSGELILARPITSDPGLISERGIPRPWSDADTATLQTFIQKHYIPKIGREKIDAIVSMYTRQRGAFHPVRDYLHLLDWDGVPRLDTWMRDYWGATKQPPEYLAAVGAAWMISAVARIMQPGCQADYALVLEGDQGVRKSTALRILSGDDYFSDSLPADLSHKDARDHLRGKWIVELPELAQFKRNEIETVKAFITRRHEQYRPSYGHHEIRFPRQCVFAGSTNDEAYLVDTTGNRRFWVIACGRVNLEAMTRDRDQLWAEAAHRYRKGDLRYLTPAQEALASIEAAARVAHDPWTSQVALIVAERLKGADASAGEVLEHMGLPQTERHARNAARVGSILMNLSWKRGKRDRTRGQLYARPAIPLPPSA
jgi:predicted P-loop ATPase